jgi:hypothetical protein
MEDVSNLQNTTGKKIRHYHERSEIGH